MLGFVWLCFKGSEVVVVESIGYAAYKEHTYTQGAFAFYSYTAVRVHKAFGIKIVQTQTCEYERVYLVRNRSYPVRA